MIPCREKKQCKVPKAGECLAYWRNSMKVGVAGGISEVRVVGDEVEEVLQGSGLEQWF